MGRLLENLSSFLVSLGLFIAIIQALNLFGVIYYPTIRRITWERVADLALTGDRNVDLILMAVALALGLALMLRDRRGLREKLPHMCSYFILILAAIEAISLIRWLLYPIYPTPLYGDPSWHFPYLEMQLFYISGLLTPYLLVLLYFWWLIRPLADLLPKVDFEFRPTFPARWAKGLLLFSMAMSVFVAIYPYLPSVNPHEVSVSVDVRYYKEWLEEMDKAPDAVSYAFTQGGNSGDRPIPLLLMYSLAGLSGNEEWAIRLIPVLLGPLLILSVFRFVKKGTKSPQLAAIAALFTLFSYHETIGLYSGFFANWIALIFSYLFMSHLVALWDSESFKDYSLALASSLGVLLSHSATWTMLMIGFGLFLVLTVAKERKLSKKVLLMLSLLALCLLTDQARTLLLGARSGVEWGVELTSPIGLGEFMRRWYNVAYATHVYLGGFYTNFITPLLALYASLFMKLEDRFDRLLLGMVALGSVAFALGNYGFQVRVLYNLPIQVLSALGYCSILGRSKRAFEPWLLLSVFVLLFQFDYLFRTLANLPL